MKRNRILAIGIALLLAVQLLTPLACAAGTTLKLTAPDKLPDVGQTFTVTAELTGNTGLAAVQLSLGYDDSVVECTGIENGALVAGMLAASNPYATRDGVGAILAAATTTAVKTDGSLAVFTFRVKAAGDAKLTLADALLSDIDGKALSLSYSLPALIAQGSGSDSGSGSGSDAEKPGTDNKKSEDDKKSEDEDKPEDEEKPADGAQEEVKSGSFRDVTSAHWAFASVERAAELGLVTGYSDGTFRPDTPVTRAQFVLMLWRMCGKPAAAKAASFADASADWYQDALSWAVEKGYVNGLSDTRFGPDAPITRQQAMAILFRLNGGQSGTELTLTGIYEQTFADSTTIAAWAKDATWWAVYHELVSGVGGSRIAPEANASRAQIAAILLRYADQFMTMEEAA
ncbi:MAG: S-layer homology domain-containing protein [Oscillospiraceae bacterium]